MVRISRCITCFRIFSPGGVAQSTLWCSVGVGALVRVTLRSSFQGSIKFWDFEKWRNERNDFYSQNLIFVNLHRQLLTPFWFRIRWFLCPNPFGITIHGEPDAVPPPPWGRARSTPHCGPKSARAFCIPRGSPQAIGKQTPLVPPSPSPPPPAKVGPWPGHTNKALPMFQGVVSSQGRPPAGEGSGRPVMSAFVELVFDNSDSRLMVDWGPPNEVRLRRARGPTKGPGGASPPHHHHHHYQRGGLSALPTPAINTGRGASQAEGVQQRKC